MKRSMCAALFGGLLLSFGCEQDPAGSDPVAGEAPAPHLAETPDAVAMSPADAMPVGKTGADLPWDSLAGPLGDTRDEALVAAEARLQAIGDHLAEIAPTPEGSGDGPGWLELQERVDRVRRDVVRLGAATPDEWTSVKTDLEQSFAAIDAMLKEAPPADG